MVSKHIRSLDLAYTDQDELVPNMFLNTDALKVLQRFAKLFIKCFNGRFHSDVELRDPA